MSEIARYLEELSRGLGISGEFKSRILIEAESHLRDSALVYESQGNSKRDAEINAIRDFGPVGNVVAAFDEIELEGEVVSFVGAGAGGKMVELELLGIKVRAEDPNKLKTNIGIEEVEGLGQIMDAFPASTPLMLFKEKDGSRRLPIFIGAVEATAIAFVLSDIKTARPMTHDLFASAFRQLDDVSVEKVVITKLLNNPPHRGTFFAEIRGEHHGEPFVLDSRPSDAVALAVRLGAPIFADTGVEEAFIAA